LISVVSGASLYGQVSVNGNSYQSGNVAEAKIKGFKAVLYLFAPTAWIDAWDKVPAEGQQCFFMNAASNPANTAVFSSDDTQQIKQLVQTQCPTGATEIGNFLDATEASVKSLPATFLADSKAYGVQAQQIGEQLKQSMSTGGANVQQQLGSSAAKQQLSQFSAITADFVAKIATYSDADRQQISAAFPKLQPFISGDHAVEFLNEVSALYKTLGAGNFDANALKAQAQSLKPTLQAVWEQYKTVNADGLQQAGQLLGKDLTKADSMLNMQGGASSGQNGFNFGGQNSQNSQNGQPQIPNAIAQRIEQGKQEFAQGGDRVQQWLQNAKQNTQQGLQETKENINQRVQEFKDKMNEFKEKHSQNAQANGQASVNGNGVGAGLNVN